MYCGKCGAKQEEGAKFCGSCGADLSQSNAEIVEEKPEEVVNNIEPTVNNQQPETIKDGKATAALVLGICSIVFFYFLGLPLGIIGLILALISKERSGKRTAGLITSVIGAVISLLFLIYFIWIMFIVGQSISSATNDWNNYKNDIYDYDYDYDDYDWDID